MPIINNLLNQKFGSLTVIEKTNQRGSNGSIIWKCQCDCGAISYKSAKDLKKRTVLYCNECKHKNEIGKRYGKLTIIKPIEDNRPGQFWLCQCDCGKTTITKTTSLHSGDTKSCGCLQKEKAQAQFLDFTGQKIGRWTVLEKTEIRNKSKQIMWKCQCSCDKQTIKLIAGVELNRGTTLSCGCLRQSHGEIKISNILTENNILFETEKTFESCVFPDSLNRARFDFFVNNQYAIEYDGIQHFRATNGDKELVKKTQERDKFKNKWCIQNNIPLIRIPYTKLKDLQLKDLQLETTEYLVNNLKEE